MKTKKLLLLTGLLFTACSGNPSLPTRQIDHPYTPPRDTRVFGLGAGFTHVKQDNSPATTRLILPGAWRLPISDTWTWEVLTAVSHQIYRDEEDTFGLRFGATSVGYSTITGWFVEPMVSIYYRRLYSPDFALEHTLGGSYAIREKERNENSWRTYLKNSLVFQLDDTKSLVPSFTLAYERAYHPVASISIIPEDRTTFTVPLGLDFSWRLAKQWESVVQYGFDRIGYTRGYRAHSASAQLIYYW